MAIHARLHSDPALGRAHRGTFLVSQNSEITKNGLAVMASHYPAFTSSRPHYVRWPSCSSHQGSAIDWIKPEYCLPYCLSVNK